MLVNANGYQHVPTQQYCAYFHLDTVEHTVFTVSKQGAAGSRRIRKDATVKKIAVVAANGKAGQLIVKEAVSRGMDVTAFVRGENRTAAEKSVVMDIMDIKASDLAGFNAVVDAFGAWTPETLDQHSTTLAHLCDCVAGTNVRLLVVGGAGSLYVDPEHTMTVSDTPDFPDIFKPELMVTAFDVKYGKPNPEPYLMGLKKGGIKANEAIVVENAPLGVQAAVAADIFTVAVNTGPLPDNVLTDAGANLLFSSMKELSQSWESLRESFGTPPSISTDF